MASTGSLASRMVQPTGDWTSVTGAGNALPSRAQADRRWARDKARPCKRQQGGMWPRL